MRSCHIYTDNCSSGANDFFFNPNLTGSDIASLIDDQIGQLYQAGARRLMLASYPDLGKIPAALNYSATADSLLTQQTLQLRNSTMQLADKWTGQVAIEVIDNYQLFTHVQESPQMYGVDPANVQRACIVGVYPSEGLPLSVCSDPENYLFWDIFHPTTRFHKVVSGLFASALINLG